MVEGPHVGTWRTVGGDPLMYYRESNVTPYIFHWGRSSFLASTALASLVTPVPALGSIYSTFLALDHSICLLFMRWQLPFPSSFVLVLLNPRGSCSTDSIWIQLMKNSITSILDCLISGFSHIFALYTLTSISFISLEQITISMERKCVAFKLSSVLIRIKQSSILGHCGYSGTESGCGHLSENTASLLWCWKIPDLGWNSNHTIYLLCDLGKMLKLCRLSFPLYNWEH